MKKLLIGVIMTLAVVGVLAGCAAEAKIYSDAGQTINAAADTEFTIALDSNITTGYSWQAQYDNKVLSLMEQIYKEKKVDEGVVGAGGTEYFRFKTVGSGETKVTFTYKRPWEQPSPLDKVETFTVNVTSG